MSFIKMLQQVFELGSCEAKKNIEIIQQAFELGAREDSINKFSNYVLVEIILSFFKMLQQVFELGSCEDTCRSL